MQGAEAAILRLHEQDWAAEKAAGDDGREGLNSSRYMDVLVRRLTHCRCSARHFMLDLMNVCHAILILT